MTLKHHSIYLLSASSLAALTTACSTDESRSGATGDPCLVEYAQFCGAVCDGNADCTTGLHCDDQACTAECSTATPCASGYRCTAEGRCEQDEAGGDAGQGYVPPGGGGDGGGPVCVDIDLQFDEMIPSVVLLIDRSGSMNAEFPGASNRWEAVKQALLDPDSGVIPQLQDRVRFGLLLYTSDDGNEGGQCPQLIGDGIPIALDNLAAIKGVYEPADYLTDGDTPTAEAVVAAREMLQDFSEPGPKVIVLATDGEPDTCEDADAHNDVTNQRSVSTVAETYAAGISVSIIAVGDEVRDEHLQQLANAGAGLPPVGGPQQATPYEPSDRQGLIDAFSTIVNGARSCEVDLDHEVSDPASGSVVLDGNALPYGDDNGWRLTSSTRLELLGEACERLKQDAAGLRIRFPGCQVTPI